MLVNIYLTTYSVETLHWVLNEETQKKLKRFIEVYHVYGKPIQVTRMWDGGGKGGSTGRGYMYNCG